MLDPSSSNTSITSLSMLPMHSEKTKTRFLELLVDAFPAFPDVSMDNTTGFIKTVPDSPPFKRDVQYISFKTDFDNDTELEYDTDAELLCLRL